MFCPMFCEESPMEPGSSTEPPGNGAMRSGEVRAAEQDYDMGWNHDGDQPWKKTRTEELAANEDEEQWASGVYGDNCWNEFSHPGKEDYPASWDNPSFNGKWMWNEGWGAEYIFLPGWIYVQGYFDWGAALTWHVQKTMFFVHQGGLMWVCILWEKQQPHIQGPLWRHTLMKQSFIPWAEQHKYPRWMIHEPKGAPYIRERERFYILYVLHITYCIYYALL